MPVYYDTCKGKLTVEHIDQNPPNNDINNLKVLCTSHHIRFDQPFHITSMSSTKKTDNSHLQEKVNLRLETVKSINKDVIDVLELYAGSGVIWSKIQDLSGKRINVLKIEIKDGKIGVYLKGDNAKFITIFDYSKFDIIDVDAYGVPYFQLKTILTNNFKGFVHVTFIQSGMGNLPNGLLNEIGYPKEMVSKCRTLFSKNGMNKMEAFLANNGVKKLTGFFIDRKNYFYFKL